MCDVDEDKVAELQGKADDLAAEVMRLRDHLAKVGEERDVLRGMLGEGEARARVGPEGRGRNQLVAVVLAMPKSFLTSYGEVWLAGSGRHIGPKSPDYVSPRGSTGKKFGSGRGFVGEEGAIRVQKRADQRLRSLGRQMKAELHAERRPKDAFSGQVCGDCRRFCAAGDRYCSWCGSRLVITNDDTTQHAP